LADKIAADKPLLLYGDLGAGKTELARAIIKKLANANEIPSPTFTLVQDYGTVAHFDLYRLKTADEAFELDLDTYIKTRPVIIEWPQLVEDYIAANFAPIKLELKLNGDTRTATFF